MVGKKQYLDITVGGIRNSCKLGCVKYLRNTILITGTRSLKF